MLIKRLAISEGGDVLVTSWYAIPSTVVLTYHSIATLCSATVILREYFTMGCVNIAPFVRAKFYINFRHTTYVTELTPTGVTYHTGLDLNTCMSPLDVILKQVMPFPPKSRWQRSCRTAALKADIYNYRTSFSICTISPCFLCLCFLYV